MRAAVILPYLKREFRRDPEYRLEEAVNLAAAIALDIAHREAVGMASFNPSSLIGKGKIAEFAALAEEGEIGLFVIDHALSPIQQRNLEKALGAKVIDRTALILEIFGERARTAEGKLQVELAALTYQKSRLVRSWTHLERQRGGAGFMGGPGERQIELDRRLIADRIILLKKQLEKVRQTRGLHRKQRREVPYPVVALVGYTNAGKSTLFNRLTGAKVIARDQLFATLDPTLRRIRLPSGQEIMLSDTVGFISDLPTHLVASFRATLEEVTEAELLLEVRDVAHAEWPEQHEDVTGVLKTLLSDEELAERRILLDNKIDLLPVDERQSRRDAIAEGRAVSALSGEGIGALLARLDATLADRLLGPAQEYRIPADDGKSLAWLRANGKVTAERWEDDAAVLSVRLSPADAARFKRRKR